MKLFLPDNLKLLSHLKGQDKLAYTLLLPSMHPNFREVSSLLSWTSCFAQYTAILTEYHLELVKSRLAYMSLLVREAR